MSELSDDARALLRDMRRDDLPDDARRARVRAALSAHLAATHLAATHLDATTPSTHAPTAAAKAPLSGLALKLTVVASLVTALSVGVAVQRREPPRPHAPRARVVALRSQGVIAPTVETPIIETPTVETPVVPVVGRRVSPPRAVVARRSSPLVVTPPPPPVVEPPPPTVAAPGRSIAAELELLQRSQLALDQHRTAEALRLLDEYAATHPDGVLRQEAAAQRVLALCARGRGAEARALGTSVLRDAPGSPAATRVRESCAAQTRSTPDE